MAGIGFSLVSRWRVRLPIRENYPCSHDGSMLVFVNEGDRKVQVETILGK